MLKKYLEAVTLGAFSFRDAPRAQRFFALARETPVCFLLLHFFLVSMALNFPLMLAITRLPPHEAFTRLYGENPAPVPPEAFVDDFDLYMYERGYGRTIMMPLIVMAFTLVLILQTVFYLLAALFMGLQRMNFSPLPFPAALNFLVLSSTLPVFLAALFGLWLPAVHIMLFYLAVIIISFHRSKLCQNG
ncbi:MAG: hypothetical protein LBL43_05435 [Treponema sp.]|nr:hypothetical protein [Treponema sp.]